jgi:site-specific DNA-adenine methylase
VDLKPFFRYYGGKWRVAPKYPSPSMPSVVEPFAGAAGYATRHHALRVRLYDTSPYVVGTWDYLIRTPSAEIRRLPLYDGSWSTVDELTHLPQEARWVIGWWLNTGTTSPHKSPSKWMRDTPVWTAWWGPQIRERLARQADEIRHWRVWQRSWTDVPTGRAATWFVDPPYDNFAGARYPFSDVDYRELAQWCRRLRGQVIVCENDGATWLPFKPLTVARGANGRHKSRTSAVESVYVRG